MMAIQVSDICSILIVEATFDDIREVKVIL